MLDYKRIASRPRILRSLTGMTCEAFARLLPAFRQAYEQALDEEDARRNPPRQRSRGAGRKPVLRTTEDKLVFILLYFRLYPTQEVLGFLFGFGQPQANYWIHDSAAKRLSYRQVRRVRRELKMKNSVLSVPALSLSKGYLW